MELYISICVFPHYLSIFPSICSSNIFGMINIVSKKYGSCNVLRCIGISTLSTLQPMSVDARSEDKSWLKQKPAKQGQGVPRHNAEAWTHLSNLLLCSSMDIPGRLRFPGHSAQPWGLIQTFFIQFWIFPSSMSDFFPRNTFL